MRESVPDQTKNTLTPLPSVTPAQIPLQLPTFTAETASNTTQSAEQQPDLQTQLEKTKRSSFDFSRVKIFPAEVVQPQTIQASPLRASFTKVFQQQLHYPIQTQSLLQRSAEPRIQRFGEPAVGPLSAVQVNDAISWYARQRRKYTPEIIKQIQTQVGTEPDGWVGPLTVQAVAQWQQEHPPLKVDGKAGPRTLPALFPTGLADSAEIEVYVGEAKQIQADWAKFQTLEERADALLTAVNKRLTAANVPPCNKDVQENLLPTGRFNPITWTIILSQRQLSKAILTNEDAAEIAETVYHEARHAEQDHSVARMLAGRGKSAQQIHAEMSIHKQVAEDAASKPLKPGSMEALIAEGWYESEYGSQAAHRIQVMKAVRAKKKAMKVNEAEEEYNKNPTPENKAKKEALRKQFEATAEFKAYQDLPQEADAWRVGTDVKDAYLKQ